jgi:F-type H+-transporting ATPase subunit b
MQELLHALHIEPNIMAAQVTGFVLLWILLARYLFKPMLALLQTRANEIKATYDKADAERSVAEELKAQLDARLAGIEAEARTRIQAAIKEAQVAKDDMLANPEARGGRPGPRAREDPGRDQGADCQSIDRSRWKDHRRVAR